MIRLSHYGAVGGSNDRNAPDAARRALEAAYDEVRDRRAKGVVTREVLELDLDGGEAWLDRPWVCDLPDVTLRSTDGSRLRAASSGIVFGVPRFEPESSNRPDLRPGIAAGELDASLRDAPRYAIRTGTNDNKGRATLFATLKYTSMSQPLADGWEGLRRFTISIIVRNPMGGTLPKPVQQANSMWLNWAIGGARAVEPSFTADPILIRGDDAGMALALATTRGQASGTEAPEVRVFNFAIPCAGVVGSVKADITVDLVEARVSALVQGRPVAVAGNDTKGWAAANDLHLAPSLDNFKLGGSGNLDLNVGPEPNRDIMIAGLHLREGLHNLAGQSDRARLFEPAEETLALLPLRERNGQLVEVLGRGGKRSHGLLLPIKGAGSMAGWIASGNHVEGLDVTGDNEVGAPLVYGASINSNVRDVRVTGGRVGIGQYAAWGNHWFRFLQRIETSYQRDAAVEVRQSSQVHLDGWYCPLVGRTALLSRESGVIVERSHFNNETERTRTILDATGGLYGRLIDFDQEGRGATHAVVAIGPSWDGPGALTLLDCTWSHWGPEAVGVLLTGAGRESRYTLTRRRLMAPRAPSSSIATTAGPMPPPTPERNDRRRRATTDPSGARGLLISIGSNRRRVEVPVKRRSCDRDRAHVNLAGSCLWSGGPRDGELVDGRARGRPDNPRSRGSAAAPGHRRGRRAGAA